VCTAPGNSRGGVNPETGVLIVLSSLQIRVASRPCSQLRSRDRSIVASGQILTRSARMKFYCLSSFEMYVKSLESTLGSSIDK
jgi:hypothetical protein